MEISDVQPAPYTPATVEHIKEFARTCLPADIARAIGWPLESLQRIARRHSINFVATNKPKPDRADVQPASAAKTKRATQSSLPALFDINTSPAEISYQLRGQARDVFEVLRAECNGRYLDAREIGSRAFIYPEHVRNALFKLKMKLRGSRFCIEKQMTWHGGYRLADIQEKLEQERACRPESTHRCSPENSANT
jgi:hypothetical protein